MGMVAADTPQPGWAVLGCDVAVSPAWTWCRSTEAPTCSPLSGSPKPQGAAACPPPSLLLPQMQMTTDREGSQLQLSGIAANSLWWTIFSSSFGAVICQQHFHKLFISLSKALLLQSGAVRLLCLGSTELGQQQGGCRQARERLQSAMINSCSHSLQ